MNVQVYAGKDFVISWFTFELLATSEVYIACMKKESTKNYIDNEEFMAELIKWRDSHEDPDERQPSERLGQILLDLHDGILRHSNFRNYRPELKEEMRSYSIYRILKRGLKTFDF